MFTGELEQDGFKAVNVRFTVFETTSHSERLGTLTTRVFGRLLNYPGPPDRGRSFNLTCGNACVKGAFVCKEGRFEAVSWENHQ